MLYSHELRYILTQDLLPDLQTCIRVPSHHPPFWLPPFVLRSRSILATNPVNLHHSCPFLTQEEQACPLWCGQQHCSHIPWDIYIWPCDATFWQEASLSQHGSFCQPSIPGMLIQKHPSALSGATQESVPDSLRPHMEKQHYRARLHLHVDDKISSCVRSQWPW